MVEENSGDLPTPPSALRPSPPGAGGGDGVPASAVSPSNPVPGRGWIVAGTVAALLIALAMVALPLAWRGPDAAQLNPWTAFFGTLHPLVLHLPIGIVILVCTMELLGWLSFGRYRPRTTMALGIGLLSAATAVVFGYLLFMSGDYGKAAIDRGIGRHMWGSIAFTALLAAAFAAKLWNDYDGRRPALYGTLLAAAIGTLTLAAHEGAILTHGSDPVDGLLHLIRTGGREPAATTAAAPGVVAAGDRLLYEQVVVSLLNKYCYECHSEAGKNPVHAAGKVKGKLSMTSLDGLLKGGSSELPSLVPGDAGSSLMIEVMKYPLDEDGHMPPEDSPQPSGQEIELLSWWIAAGAPTGKTVSETGGGDAFLPLIETLPLPPEPASGAPAAE